MNRKKLLSLCECGVLLAMSTALGFVTIWRAPMGGSVTLLSMLPLLIVGVLHGYRAGLGTAFVYSLIQLVQAVFAGNVFVYCYTPEALIVCVLFDYVLPFTALGLTAAARPRTGCGDKKLRRRFVAAVCVLVVFRFVCHFVTGVAIWGQWAPDGMGRYLYSLIYNGTYMLPELVLTAAGAVILSRTPQFMKLLHRYEK